MATLFQPPVSRDLRGQSLLLAKERCGPGSISLQTESPEHRLPDQMQETNVSLSPAPVTRPQEQKDKWPERGSGKGCSHTGRGEGGREGPGGEDGMRS